MKRLEDIPKKDIFSVPDGYFDRLPGIIQSRVAPSQPEPRYSTARFVLRFALPVMVVFALALFLFRNPTVPDQNPEDILATVSSEAMVAYLEESDLTIEDILDNVDYSDDDVIQIEQETEVLPDDADLGSIIDELQLGTDF